MKSAAPPRYPPGPEGWPDPRPAGLGQRDYPKDARAPALTAPGYRPVPHRAHVLRAGAPADRAAHDPG
jgi:hypothetical protein